MNPSNPSRRLLLDLTSPDDDLREYKDEHYRLFGHMPQLGLIGSNICAHQMHVAMRQIIDAPGVDLLVGFDSAEVVGDDEAIVKELADDYDRRVQDRKAVIKDLDERREFRDRRKHSHDGGNKRLY